MNLTGDRTPYRIGFGRDFHRLRGAIRDRDWHHVRLCLRWMRSGLRRRSWWGLWQAEWPGCRRAVRGITANHAYRRAQKKENTP